jgi:hypothetical protein
MVTCVHGMHLDVGNMWTLSWISPTENRAALPPAINQAAE